MTTDAEIRAALLANARDTSIPEGSKIQDKILASKDLSALTAAWYWSQEYTKTMVETMVGTKVVTKAKYTDPKVPINDQASNIIWNSSAVDPNQDTEFNKISIGINGGENGLVDRWLNYKNNVIALLNGGNPYESMREVLARLGVTTVAGRDYAQQFGISLAARKPVDIVDGGTHNLMAATGEVLSVTPDGPDLTAEQQAQLWAQAEPLLAQLKQSTEEKSAMFIPNIGQAAGLLLGAAVAVAAPPVQAADNYMLGICEVSQPDSGAEIAPTINGNSYLYTYHSDLYNSHSGDPRYQGFTFDDNSVKVTLVKAPAHGRVEHVESNYYHYYSDEGYVGQDRFVMQVEKNGIKVRIQYLMEEVPKYGPSDYLCIPDMWKISATTPALDNARLQALLGAANINNNVSVTFSDLAGGAVGQTVGTNITLDPTAAGYNWFIDPTPADNSEYLPTSNPNEWVAKAGTAAYGKMDMLSVLLHEYGHALGIEHSPDNHDYMSTTLTPGVRRLPSAAELALMQQLIAQAKGSVGRMSAALSDVGMSQQTAEGASLFRPTTPDNSPIPFPLPLGGLGFAFAGLLRPNRYGGSSIDVVTTPQYDVAANASFIGLNDVVGGASPTMPGTARPTGWDTQGSVDVANGIATLNEISAAQTRLSQVFMLGANDRYLSFTLAGSALNDPLSNFPPQAGARANGAAGGSGLSPSDAFEVALLDANTGLSVLGTDGLTRTDAFLNLQADGAQHTADCVTCINNADGSRTYRVDLTNVAKNRAVNLSFDLLGFGVANSQVTLRDIRTSGLPQLRDDVASIAEDNTLGFDPYAQADAALRPMLASSVVNAPTHGAITVNADGSVNSTSASADSGLPTFGAFSYTPDLNYFGADITSDLAGVVGQPSRMAITNHLAACCLSEMASCFISSSISFSYRLSDPSTGSGQALDSNLATVITNDLAGVV